MTAAVRGMIRPLAIERAWHLASLHGHHWAVDGRPVAWAYARAARAAEAARHALQQYDGCLSDEPELVRSRMVYDAAAEAREAAEAAWGACVFDANTVEIIPRSVEEADLIGARPAGPLGGICFSLSHRTVSGRLGWEIAPDGVVTLTIYRPEDLPVLRATIHADLGRHARRVTIEVLRAKDVEMRHASTLTKAINAVVGGHLHPSVVMEEVYDLLPSRRTADVMAELDGAGA